MEKVLRKGLPVVKARAFWKKREWDSSLILRSILCFVGSALVTVNPILPESAGLGCVLFAGYFDLGFSALLAYVVFGLLRNFSLYTLLAGILPAALALVVKFTYERVKGRSSVWLLLGAGVILRCIGFFTPEAYERPLAFLFDSALCAALAGVLINGFKAPILRGLKTHLSTDEKVCLCLAVCCAAGGIYGVELFGVKLWTICYVGVILLTLYLFGKTTGFVLSMLLGLTQTMASGEILYLGVYALYALIAIVFLDTSKALSCLSVVLVDLLLAYYFKLYAAYDFFDLLSLLLAVLPCLVLPSSCKKKVQDLFTADQVALEGMIVRRNKQSLQIRLNKMSGIFAEMNGVFQTMSHSGLEAKQAVGLFYDDFLSRICEGCENFDHCFGARNSKMRESLLTLLSTGIEKGKINLIDIPEYFAKKCMRTNPALQVINQYFVSYRRYCATMANLDSTRRIIGKQMLGVSNLLKTMSGSDSGEVNFRPELEQSVKDSLLNAHLTVHEVAVYTENGKTYVTAVVRESDSVRSSLTATVSKAVGTPMMVTERKECAKPGYVSVEMMPAPKYDVVFGASGCKKAGSSVSGDTQSPGHLSENRFMLALCDGMGSGEDALKTSANSISLIENFYRAGFDSELILDSVNGLLSSCQEEVYCTIDIAVVDLNKGRCDFIKLGAVPGFIKSDRMEMISGNSLPLGILEETTPSTDTRVLKHNDMVVLVTDGILDAFREVSAFSAYLETVKTSNPQELADAILETAIRKNNNRPKDDMTVLTLRLFEKAA